MSVYRTIGPLVVNSTVNLFSGLLIFMFLSSMVTFSSVIYYLEMQNLTIYIFFLLI